MCSTVHVGNLFSMLFDVHVGMHSWLSWLPLSPEEHIHRHVGLAGHRSELERMPLDERD